MASLFLCSQIVTSLISLLKHIFFCRVVQKEFFLIFITINEIVNW